MTTTNLDEIKNALINIQEISKNLEAIKEKMESGLMSDDEATIIKLNKELTEIINDLNSFVISNANEFNNIQINSKWIN